MINVTQNRDQWRALLNTVLEAASSSLGKKLLYCESDNCAP